MVAEETPRYLRCNVCLQEVVAIIRFSHLFEIVPYCIASRCLKLSLHQALNICCQRSESSGENLVIERVALWPTSSDHGVQFSKVLRLPSQFLLVLRDGDLLIADQLDLLSQLVFELVDAALVRNRLG